MYLENYFETAQKYENIFRNILRDLSNKECSRPLGTLVPIDLNPEEDLSEIYLKYSSPNLSNKFTILYFRIDEKGRAIVAFDNIGNLANFTNKEGNGVELRYLVNRDNSVKFETKLMDWNYKT